MFHVPTCESMVSLLTTPFLPPSRRPPASATEPLSTTPDAAHGAESLVGSCGSRCPGSAGVPALVSFQTFWFQTSNLSLT